MSEAAGRMKAFGRWFDAVEEAAELATSALVVIEAPGTAAAAGSVGDVESSVDAESARSCR